MDRRCRRTLILRRLRHPRRARRRGIWGVVVEHGESVPFVTRTFEWAAIVATLWSVWGIGPRCRARSASFLHPQLRESRAVLNAPQPMPLPHAARAARRHSPGAVSGTHKGAVPGINGRYRSTERPRHRQFQPLVHRFVLRCRGGGGVAKPCNDAALPAVGGVHRPLAIHKHLDQALLRRGLPGSRRSPKAAVLAHPVLDLHRWRVPR